MTNIIELLQAERARIDRALAVLTDGTTPKRRGRPPANPLASILTASITGTAQRGRPAGSKNKTPHTHRVRTAAQKAAQSAKMRAYWKKVKKTGIRKQSKVE